MSRLFLLSQPRSRVFCSSLNSPSVLLNFFYYATSLCFYPTPLLLLRHSAFARKRPGDGESL
jgi:hypothetical protein